MPSQLKEPQRAAALILSMDKPIARRVLRHLNDDELRRLTKVSESLPKVDAETLEEISETFCKVMHSPLAAGAGGDYARKLVLAAVGEERARGLFKPPVPIPPALEALRAAHAPTLAELLANEHPQIAAVLLTQLPESKAAQVLEVLEEDDRLDLIARIVEIEEVPMQQIEIVSEELARALEVAGGITALDARNDFDAVRFTAGLLNELPSDLREPALENLETEDDSELADKVREAMFTFEDLGQLSVRDVQLLMREVDKDTILIALKTANEELRDKLLSGVSSRAAKQIIDELPLLPPTKLSDVERAQREAVEAAMRLAEEGRLVLPGGDGEKMV